MSSLPVPVEPDAATQMEAFARAVDARDPRFDGVFFVAITTTRIYCRPVCPSRMANNRHRRFFHSAAAAEHAGFRPCLRCRPELAPGRSFFDVVSRLAHSAALRIEAGALNGASVMDLARDLGVSERHLRRALEREIGVSPLDLAQTHRLLLAKQLLVDTGISVTRVAFASGFQSLRRFNTAFREQYRMPPSALRRKLSPRRNGSSPEDNVLRLTLGYRRPFAWKAHVALLQGEAIQGIESVDRDRYSRTIRIGPHTGYFTVRDAEPSHPRTGRIASHLDVEISASLVPALMPLIARLRYVFDLDAEPGKIDAHLEQGGLADL
ncbi:MAG: AlkA N-terminal domain-containing protein, partial [Gemmatimonadota bacterium]